MKIIPRTDGRYRHHKEYKCLIQFRNSTTSTWAPPGFLSENAKFWALKDWLSETYGPDLDLHSFVRNANYRIDWQKDRRIYLKDDSYLILARLAVPEIFQEW